MPRPSRPWFRFYVEAVRDRKLRRRKPAHRWLWVVLLAMARASSRPGWVLIGQTPAQVGDIADEAALRPAEVKAGLAELEAEGMLVREGDAWRVVNWNARQFESDSSAERVSQHRDRKRGKAVTETPAVTPPETEAETENRKPPSPSASGRSQPATHKALYGALITVFGDVSTSVAKSFYGKCARELREAGATPDEVVARGRFLLTKNWTDSGAGALVKHWDRLVPPPDRRPRVGGLPVDMKG